MRIVVAGSSGYIGTALLHRLNAAGHQIVRLVRSAPEQPDEVRWYPDQQRLDPGVLDGAQAVINLAGAGVGDQRWTPEYRALLRSSRIDPTTVLAHGIAAASDPPRVLLNASAVGFYGDAGDTELNEASPPGQGFLADLCQAWEQATQPARDAGARVVQLRTGLLLGPHSGLLKRLLPIFELGLGGRLGSGRQWMPWISLADEVATLTKPLSAYPVPTDPIDGVSGLRGKVVYYIPVSSQAPAFGVTGTALTAAAKAAGMRVQICDGKGTPTAIAACISQATDAKAGAIVADSVAYALAAHAFDAARAADIPVVINNQLPDPTHPADKTLAYIQGGGTQMDQALATWVSLDSQGKANVLINQSVDGPSPAAYVAAAKKVYAHDCGGCKVTLNQVSSANFSLVPSSTSAALLKAMRPSASHSPPSTLRSPSTPPSASRAPR